MAREELTAMQVAGVFIFGSLNDLSHDVQDLWLQAINGFVQLNQTFLLSHGKDESPEVIQQVTHSQAGRMLWEAHVINGSLSP